MNLGNMTEEDWKALREARQKVMLEQHPDLVKSLQRIQEMAKPFAAAFAAIQQAIVPYREAFQNIVKLTEPFRDLLKMIAELEKQNTRLEEAGWLPHYTTPLGLLKDNPHWDRQMVTEQMEAYYRENWGHIRERFEESLQGMDLDVEAKAAMRDALQAHEHGLYRVTPRLIFPAIERIVRNEFEGGKVSRMGMASLPQLQKIAVGMSVSVAPRGYYVIRLYRRLKQHLYAKVDTQDRVDFFAKDPVPNRHAAIHGIIIYDTLQNSINALIMADYIYQVLSAYIAMGKEPDPGSEEE